MEIAVGMGEIEVTESAHLLGAVGIGSCVAVALYDSYTRIGGLAHIVLPYMEEAHDNSHPARFADVAIGMMIDEMKRRGARIQNIGAKIFGGANMFPEIDGLTCLGYIMERFPTPVVMVTGFSEFLGEETIKAL